MIEDWIQKIEMVSSYFGYTEEYVLDHTFPWLYRKFEQVHREQFDKSSVHIIEGYKSLLLLMDSAFNKGKGFDTILPSSYDHKVNQNREKREQESKFVSGQWWNQSA